MSTDLQMRLLLIGYLITAGAIIVILLPYLSRSLYELHAELQRERMLKRRAAELHRNGGLIDPRKYL